MEKTKLVRINLAVLTRVEYSEVVEVPSDMTEEELEALVDQRYREVDGGEYWDDSEYWERSTSCGFAIENDSQAEVTKRLCREKNEFLVTDV